MQRNTTLSTGQPNPVCFEQSIAAVLHTMGFAEEECAAFALCSQQ